MSRADASISRHEEHEEGDHSLFAIGEGEATHAVSEKAPGREGRNVSEEGRETLPASSGMTAQAFCLWCGSTPAVSLEHILPDALGCPPDFVLNEGVCKKCNFANGKLDRAVLKPFELITVVKGSPRKKGKRPTVDGFSTVSSGYDENGPTIFINREGRSIKLPNGKYLGPHNSQDPFQNFKHELLPSGQVKISYSQRLELTRAGVRGLFKIALESVAFFEGLAVALSPEFDGIRRFVRCDEGSFMVVMVADPSKAYDHYFAPSFSKSGFARMVGMTILGVGFACDFSPDGSGAKLFIENAKAQGIGAFAF